MKAKKSYLLGQYNLAADTGIFQTLGTQNDLVYKIAGLVFTGQHQLARILYKDHSKNLNLQDLIFANFHLGISYVRTSEYNLAQEFFIQNIKLLRTGKANPVSIFFCYQGLSFYRFFFSEHKKSYFWSTKAYSALIKDKAAPSLYLALSHDLQGHNLIQIGRIHKGLSELDKALKICTKNNFLNLQADIETSISIYKSDYSDQPQLQLKNLQNSLNLNPEQSDYSKSGVILQIAKLYLLLGQYKAAHLFLTQNFDSIYKNENKRKIAGLNTIMSKLLFKRGQHIEALSVAKIARKNLDERIDVSLILPILYLEIKILRLLKKEDSELLSYAKKLTEKVDRQLDQKMFSRLINSANNSVINYELGQDQLGDLIDLIFKKNKFSLDLLIENELFGLLPSYFDLNPGKKYLILVNDKKYMFSVDYDSVSFHGIISKNQILFIKNLTSDGISKEALIKKVWGYSYDPLRHDSLIYTTISRVKKSLSLKKQWITADDNKYFLQDDIEIIFLNSQPQSEILEEKATLIETPDIKYEPKSQPKFELKSKLRFKLKDIENYNYRQAQVISDPPDTAISVSEYAKIWNVTRMTALRDLTLLCEDGVVQKIGRGKATRYIIDFK